MEMNALLRTSALEDYGWEVESTCIITYEGQNISVDCESSLCGSLNPVIIF